MRDLPPAFARQIRRRASARFACVAAFGRGRLGRIYCY